MLTLLKYVELRVTRYKDLQPAVSRYGVLALERVWLNDCVLVQQHFVNGVRSHERTLVAVQAERKRRLKKFQIDSRSTESRLVCCS